MKMSLYQGFVKRVSQSRLTSSGQKVVSYATMAKLMVINSKEGTQVPFLRGMLTRSLQDIGLEFDEAYDLASDVKDSLSDRTTIETGELRQCVSARLREIHSEYLANRYASQIDATYQIMIRSPEGLLVPFSGEAH
ncbi:MAG: hypothetical protein KJN79_03715, partial [Gammaproteobacteria bacterium]|nr:hypothetical protein [Gammaproteobacteria bacterium]